MKAVLLDLLEMIGKKQANCAAVTLKVGGVSTSNKVLHDQIVILDAPPFMIGEVMAYARENGLYVSMNSEGLTIR